MKLYHGSLVVVDTPEIRETSHTLDYGKGFYTTTSYEQAEAWVKRKKNEWNSDKGYVNVYEFNAEAIKAIYASDTYRRLETENTKLWHLGPVALYEDIM